MMQTSRKTAVALLCSIVLLPALGCDSVAEQAEDVSEVGSEDEKGSCPDGQKSCGEESNLDCDKGEAIWEQVPPEMRGEYPLDYGDILAQRAGIWTGTFANGSVTIDVSVEIPESIPSEKITYGILHGEPSPSDLESIDLLRRDCSVVGYIIDEDNISISGIGVQKGVEAIYLNAPQSLASNPDVSMSVDPTNWSSFDGYLALPISGDDGNHSKLQLIFGYDDRLWASYDKGEFVVIGARE